MAKLSADKQDNTTRSALSAIVAGLLVVIAGFLVYNYFSQTKEKDLQEKIGGASEQVANETEEKTEKSPPANRKEEAQARENEQGNEGAVSTEGEKGTLWSARDLAPSSIQGDSYTVQRGDTLWEISEARYGSGFDWVKIRDANADTIGFLPNGSQALIFPGQVLTLP